MYIGVTLTLLIIAAILFPKSKLLTVLIMLLMFFVYSHAYFEGDLQVYEWLYTNTELGSFEKGYELLVAFSKWIGLSFFQFRMLLAGIYLILTGLAVRKFTDFQALGMAVLSVFPLFVFVSVIRSGIACAIVLYSLTFLISNKKHGTLLYLVGVLLATSFHISAIAFIVLVFTKKKINTMKMLMLIAVVSLTCYLYVYTDVIYTMVTSVISSDKIIAWFVSPELEKNIKGVAMDVIILLANIIFAKYGRDFCNTKQGREELSEERITLANISFNSSMMLFMIFPIINISGPVIRLAYTMFGVSVCVFLNGAYEGVSPSKGRKFGRIPIVLVGLIVYVIMWALYYDYPYLSAGNSAYSNLYNLIFAL